MKGRVELLPEGMPADERAAHTALIEADEAEKPTTAPVAGCDLTFSAPKSVSTLWAVADGGTQALIVALHDPASRACHERKRAQGKKDNAALACLARRRIDVLHAMLKHGTLYEDRSAPAAA